MGPAHKRYQDEEWLRQEYVEKNRSLRDIGEQFDVSATAIRHFTQKYDLPSKPRGRTFTCNYCGDSFYKMASQIEGGEGKHCSMECRHKNNQITRNCRTCGSEFTTYPSEIQNGRGKYCSQECYWQRGRQITACAKCGEKIVAYKYYVKKVERTFCSSECHSEWQSQRTGEDAFAWNGGYDHQGDNWKRNKRKTLERYDYACAICGKGEQELGRNPDVHHIIPSREFESDEEANSLDNLVPLCRQHHSHVEGWNLVPPLD